MLLGSIPPKLDRQHEKAWGLLTSPTCTQLIYSIQSHSRLTQLPVLFSTSLPPTILSSSPLDDIHCQVCQSPFDEHKILLFDICNAGWQRTAFSHPLPSSNIEPANVPYASCTTSYPRQQHDTFAFLTTHHHRPHP